MVTKPIVWGVGIIILLGIVVAAVEYNLLLSMKFEFNADCRATLLKMENENGLSITEKNKLQTKLANKGFTDITITAPTTAMQGQEINLKVEANYKYSRLISVFTGRVNSTQLMVYNKTSMARKVIN